MARRNNLLFVVLLASVGLLVGGVLFFGGSGGGTPATGDAESVADSGGPAETALARVPDSGADPNADPGVGTDDRRAVDTPPAVVDDRIELSGRLVGEGGVGVPDVELAWRPRGRFDAVEPVPATLGGADVAAARTDPEGRFRLEIGAAEGGTLILPREANLLFTQKDRRHVEVAAYGEDADLGDVTVRLGATIVGRVVDETGAALPTARVRANQGSWMLWMPGQGQSVDGEGRFELLGLEPGIHRIGAEASGFVPATETVAVELGGGSPAEVELRLSRGASIAGTVVDDRGVPVAGARVAAYRRQTMAPNVEVSGIDDQSGVESDENGYFVLSGIDGSAAALRASAKGHRAQTVPDVAIGSGSVRIEIARLGGIEGVLLDTEGSAIPGSRVSARAGGERAFLRAGGLPIELRDEASAETDEQGRFSIAGVPPGTVALSARGDGHLPVEGFSVQVAAGSTVPNVTLRADIGSRLDARVVDADGTPVAGATVVVQERPERRPQAAGVRRIEMRLGRDDSDGPGDAPARLDEPAVIRRGATDVDGRVMLAGLPAGPVQVTAENGEAAPSRPTDVTIPRRGTVETWLTLRPAGRVSLRVVDEAAQPVPGVGFVVRGPQGADAEDQVSESGTTDAVGVARIGPLLEGRYEAVLRLPPRPMSLGGGMSFTVGSGTGDELAGTTKEVVVLPGQMTDVELVQPILARITGVVRDAGGLASNIEVKLRMKDAPPFASGWDVTTDVDGEFGLDDVPAGAYRLEWGRVGQVVLHSDELIVPPATAELVRNLELRGGRVRVEVRSDAGDEPLSRAEVTLRRPGEAQAGRRGIMMVQTIARDSDDEGASGASSITMGGTPSVRTGDDGVAIIEDVPPGEYEVVVTHRRHAEGRIDKVTVVDRGEADAGSVTLATAGVIRGAVLDMPQGDVQVALVECRRVGAEGRPRVEPAMGGQFQIDSLAAGDYELRARMAEPGAGEEYGPVERVTVRAGEPTRIELRLPAR